MKSFSLKAFGLFLIVLGTVGLLIAVIMSFTKYAGIDQGALPAASFLSILLGIAFANPSMLQDTTQGLSTMRVVVFAVVLLFCTIYFKIGWTVAKFEDFTINEKWVYILGLAFGSKAFQRFTEEEGTGGEEIGGTTETKTQVVKETSTTSVGGSGPKGKDNSADALR